MVACIYGSSPKPGAPTYINLGAEEVSALFGSSYSWLGQFLPFLGQINEETAILCASEPVDTTFTATDMFDLVVPPFGAAAVAQRLRNSVLARAWPSYCQCNSGVGGDLAPCTSGTVDIGGANHLSGAGRYSNPSWYLPSDQFFPPGQHSLRMEIQASFAGSSAFEIYSSPSGTRYWTAESRGLYGGSDFVLEFVAPVTDTSWNMDIGHLGAFPVGTLLRVNYWNAATESPCVGTPIYVLPPPQAPPVGLPPPTGFTCSTTTDLCTWISRMDSKMDNLMSMVQLIQRQKVPFAYLPGPIFSGLTNSGQVAVSGILAAAVSLTTVPQTIGTEEGNPLTFYDAGWLTTGTADGWADGHRISRNPYLLADIEGDVTRLGYTLKPGVVATLSTFLREP